MMVALKPLHDFARIQQIVVSTYQAASGAGKPAYDELEQQTREVLEGEPPTVEKFSHQLAFNVIPHIDVFEKGGYTKEEWKMVHETHKILGDDTIRVTATAARVPVFYGHSESVNIETEVKLTPEKARELLKNAPGVQVVDDPLNFKYPMAIHAAHHDPTFVGRIREDFSIEKGLNLWIVADNIRKGAALNAVQIVESLVEKDLVNSSSWAGKYLRTSIISNQMDVKKILVQKYGGTSVSTTERRKQVIDHVRRPRDNGYQVAIVVSAMGRSGDPYATDTLLDLLRIDGKNVDKRDYDMVFVCGGTLSAAYMSHLLKLDGIPALGLTGAQAGFITDENHTEANIIDIDTSRIKRHLIMNEVPVVAGCQGASGRNGDFTTLGRGGSDTSGVALGAALNADKVEIFTDVEGVARVDPRLVPRAELLGHIHYNSMLEMARYGAGVVHPRAVRAGMEAGLPVVVRSTFSNNPGTMINAEPDEYPLVGLAKKGPFVVVTLREDKLGLEMRNRLEKELLVIESGR